jgi:hypothetical protein
MAGLVPPNEKGQNFMETWHMMCWELTPGRLDLELPDGYVNCYAQWPSCLLERFGGEFG